jgi:serine O-acetyltransferase
VLKAVPDDSTVVGIPGRVVRHRGNRVASSLDHTGIADPVLQKFDALQRDMVRLEQELRALKARIGGVSVPDETPRDDERTTE